MNKQQRTIVLSTVIAILIFWAIIALATWWAVGNVDFSLTFSAVRPFAVIVTGAMVFFGIVFYLFSGRPKAR